MADQNPNPNAQNNIDDLVRELSRPQNMPPAGPANPPAPVAMPPKPAMPSPAPAPAMPPRPAMPASPAPAPRPVAPAPQPQPPASAPAPGTPSYQSNIRTMADDLASLKSGKQPQGTTLPKPAMPAPTPVAMPPRPAMPASPATAPRPVAPASKPMAPPTMPVMPSSPAPSAAAPNPSQFFVPEEGAKPKGKGRELMFIGIGVAVVLLGVLYWAFFIRQPADDVAVVPVETFTPRPSATPRIPIASRFAGSAGTIAFAPGTDPMQTFTAGLKTIVVAPGQLGVLKVTDSTASASLSPFALLDRLLIPYPIELKPTLGNDDGVILAYGQQESFNAKGQPVQGAGGTRVALVTQVSDAAAGILRGWEPTMTDTLATLFGINKTKNSGPFSDALYQSTTIRFKNFAYPDMAIDYSLVPYNGVTYLVIANSREAMFAVISTLVPLGK